MNPITFTLFAAAPDDGTSLLMLVPGVIALVLIITLAVYWIVFPWLACHRLKQQNELLREVGLVLERLETETRSNNLHLQRIAEAVNPAPPVADE